MLLHCHPDPERSAKRVVEGAVAEGALAGFALISILAACAPHVPFALSNDDKSRFQENVLRVDVPGHDPMIFGMNDCIVYKAKRGHDDIVGWDVARLGLGPKQ